VLELCSPLASQLRLAPFAERSVDEQLLKTMAECFDEHVEIFRCKKASWRQTKKILHGVAPLGAGRGNPQLLTAFSSALDCLVCLVLPHFCPAA
jgi:hypothetical protein